MDEQERFVEAQRAALAASEQVAALERTADELRKRAAGAEQVSAAALSGAVVALVKAPGAALPGARLAALQADEKVLQAAIVECDVQLAAARRAAELLEADRLDAEAAVLAQESARLAAEVSAALAQVGALSGSEYLPRGGNSRADELDARSRDLRRAANALRRSHVVK